MLESYKSDRLVGKSQIDISSSGTISQSKKEFKFKPLDPELQEF